MVNKDYGFDEDEPDMVHDEELEKSVEETPKEDKGLKLSAEEIKKKINDHKIIDALIKVKDPELDMDVWNLGLIYDMDIVENKPEIKMTFTSPMCPFGPQIVESVKGAIKKLGYDEPDVEVVFNPVWEPSEEVKEMLGVG
jgi:metal-sulfur cluster biosynthetic enzyme